MTRGDGVGSAFDIGSTKSGIGGSHGIVSRCLFSRGLFWGMAAMLMFVRAGTIDAAIKLTCVTPDIPLNDDEDRTIYDFGSVSVPEDGLLVVAVRGRHPSANRSVERVSIEGVVAAINAQQPFSPRPGAIASRTVSAGVHNITAEFSNPVVNAAACVYLLTGYRSPTHSDIDDDANSSSSSLTLTLDFPANGMALYTVGKIGSSAVSWSAAESDAEIVLETFDRYEFAHKMASGNDNAETANWTGTPVNAGVAAVWAPSVAARHRKYHR
jgi:hypothetical protein